MQIELPLVYLEIDHRFNLGKFHDTIAVFSNLLLQKKITDISPSFCKPHFCSYKKNL